MNTTSQVRFRGPLRTTALWSAALMSGAALLLAGCSASSPSSSSASSAAPAYGSAQAHAPAVPAAGASQATQATQASRLALAEQNIIYTASLTMQAKNVTAAAARATSIVTAEGGYVSSEQESLNRSGSARPTVSLQLKIPVAVYQPTLSRLASVLGKQTALAEHAQDVTQQVADVTSLVGSAQDAITQLQALLKRAGSVSALLTVQDQINSQESSLEALQAQQRALARETSYATVSVMLVSPRRHSVTARKKEHGFVAGFAAGWRGLRLVVSGLLTALGAVLPFAVIVAVLAAAGFAARRRLMRLLRRRSRPTPAG
ncbi:MAG TPA: DUF4349 domain-containing protein [Streptosporangiaceae bacterium]|nr:DUF4349 domain-containing protein [Streptosporangiaceae bacterium]